MTQPHRYPDHAGKDAGPDRDGGRPRWRTALGILIAAILIVVVAYLHLAGIVGPGAH